MSFLPPGLGDPGSESDPQGSPALVEEKVDKLAAMFHLEWCDSCNDWRDLGHVDNNTSGKAGVRQAILEAETFPG